MVSPILELGGFWGLSLVEASQGLSWPINVFIPIALGLGRGPVGQVVEALGCEIQWFHHLGQLGSAGIPCFDGIQRDSWRLLEQERY